MLSRHVILIDHVIPKDLAKPKSGAPTGIVLSFFFLNLVAQNTEFPYILMSRYNHSLLFNANMGSKNFPAIGDTLL